MRLRTANGATVCAKHVALCCNAFIDEKISRHLRDRIMPVGTYIIATEQLGQARIDAASRSPIYAPLKRIAHLRADSPALQRGLQLNLEMAGDRAAFYRVYQQGGQAQIALVLLNKGDAPTTFTERRYVQAGRWRAAIGGGEVTVAEGGALSTTVPAHGVEVFLLDAPVGRADLARELDKAQAGAQPRR